jgi:hypothetical protein
MDQMMLFGDLFSNRINLQEYIDKASNLIENNKIRSYLQNFLEATQQIENHYGFQNKNEFQRTRDYDYYAKDGQVYKYYVAKIQFSYHYCLYISIPSDHCLNGKSYNNINGATYCGVDENDNTRWIFGWDYAHYNNCTIGALTNYIIGNPVHILDLDIITVSRIENDVFHNINLLATTNS